MKRLSTLGLGATAAVVSTALAAAPAQAAAAHVTATFRPAARTCSTPRVARVHVTAQHLTPGKQYLIQWTAPTRTGGSQVTQTGFVAAKSRYSNPDMAWRAATALPLRRFATKIELLVVRKSGDAELVHATKVVPACTPKG